MRNQSIIPSFEDEKLHLTDHIASMVNDGLSNEIDIVKNLLNPDRCESKYLPYLAYGDKVDFWDERLSILDKRALIKSSPKLHRLKGTRWAILEVLKAVGLSVPGYEAVIIEYKDRDKYKYDVQRDGTHHFNSRVRHNDSIEIYNFQFGHWAEYAVEIQVSMNEYKNLLARKLLKKYAPVRCSLIGFITRVQERNGTFNYDKKYTH